MTFVTEEEGINVFLKSKEVNFELAVQEPIYRTASIPKNIFLKLHEKLYVMLKGKLGSFSLYQFTGQLTEELHGQLKDLGTHGSRDLNSLVRQILYPATVNVLFKKAYCCHTDCYSKEPCYVVRCDPGKEKIEVSEDDLKKLPLIKWCILETIRLRAPGVITRKVTKPIEILRAHLQTSRRSSSGLTASLCSGLARFASVYLAGQQPPKRAVKGRGRAAAAWIGRILHGCPQTHQGPPQLISEPVLIPKPQFEQS
ncbi:hypothetical protein CB1_001402115 [Camelus ferus]|nr:hypothetical protein CB1_001402115 [Camelus ferus]